MSDQNPYQAPGEGGEPSVQALGPWPKTATVRLDKDIAVRALGLHCRRTNHWFLAAVVVSYLIMAPGLAVLDSMSSSFSHVGELIVELLLHLPALAVGVTGFVIFGRYRWTRRRVLRSLEAGHGEVHYEITPEEFHCATDESDSRIEWKRVPEWKERDGLMLVYQARNEFIIVPLWQLSVDVADAIRFCLQTSPFR